MLSIATLRLKVALYTRGLQKYFDFFCFRERGVLDEAQLGREFERDGFSHQPTDETPVPIECTDDGFRVLAAQRLNESRCMAHVAGRLYLRNGNGNAFEIRIANFAAAKDIRQGMPQQFADPQLTL
jgi:hypothetical protein